MSSKKVMILGAAQGQIPIITICKKRNYYTIVVSPRGDYPGFEMADKCYYSDTRDKDAILSIAKKEQIDAIVTDQTDVSVPTVAYVSEKMGLRGIGYGTALKFSNKYLMREAAKAIGISVPPYGKATTLEDALQLADEIGYPIMIKPADSSGSRGVVKINSDSELKKQFCKTVYYSTTGYIVVEKFIDGIEYLADGFAMNGEYVTLDVGIKEYFNIPNSFVSKMCMFSSTALITDDIEKRVAETNALLITGMRLDFGITHAEYLYCPTDEKVYLVEVAARGGGVFLSSDITPTATGFNTNEALIDFVVEGIKRIPRYNDLEKGVSAWMCFAFPEGEIFSINGMEKTARIPGVYKCVFDDLIIGKKTNPVTDDSGKHGPILIKANSKAECYRVIDKVKKTLDVKIRTAEGIKGLIW